MRVRTRRTPIDHARSPGAHVQQVNAYLGKAAGKLDEWDEADQFTQSHYPLLPALGVAWEELRASHYPEDQLVAWPGEFSRDGISGNPDGLLPLSEPEMALWECKLTTKKIQSVADCWMYLKQGLGYCALMGLRHVQYDVLWMLGDYQRPYKPQGTVTLVEFEEREVEAWWKVMLGAKSALAS